MWCNICMKVGIIGNGTHSKRIQKILKKIGINFFIYKPNNPSYYNKKDFEKLKKNEIIFILSPNHTHFNYIKKLYKNRYIFCEKPPVIKKKELIMLKKIPYGKIYFNYNFRFLEISKALGLSQKYNLKNLVYANILTGHGLSLKKEYKKSWRSSKIKCPKGVFEIVSIHWIDLINYHYKIKKIERPELINHSKIGTSFDTSHIKLTLNNNAIINIFSSYKTPLIKKILFVFENGIIEHSENYIEIRGPAINLDKNRFFKKPKLIEKIFVSELKDYENSLLKSVNFFLKISKNKKKFSKKLFNCSLDSNAHILR